MKSFLSIFLLITGIFSANLLKGQIITIHTNGRTEYGTSGKKCNPNPEVEISQMRIKKKVDSSIRNTPVAVKRFHTPLKKMTATSSYGWRKHPVTGDRKFHAGIDLKAWYEAVYAIADGVVKKACWGNIEGYYVVLTHGDAQTSYCHLSKLLCSPGDILKGGTILGISGNTGRSTGPHLHFGLKYNGLEANPKRLFNAVDL